MGKYIEGSFFNSSNRYLLFIVLLIPLLFLPFFMNLSLFVFFFFANILFSYFFKILRKFGIGVELTTFFTIILALKFGPFWGAVIGGFMMLGEYIGSARVSILSLATIPSVMLLGFMTPFFSGMEIASLGLMLSVGYNILTFFLCLMIRRRFLGLVVFSLTNIFFNRLLFLYIAPMFI